jgi:hypothetical protein
MGGPREIALSDALRAEVVEKLVDSDTIGVLLGGSFARGEETTNSDVDLLVFRRRSDPRLGENRYFRSTSEERLVTWSPTTVARELERMGHPKSAIWVVPGIRQARVVLDLDGSLAKLKAAADSFRWDTLARPAQICASEELAGLGARSLTHLCQ